MWMTGHKKVKSENQLALNLKRKALKYKTK